MKPLETNRSSSSGPATTENTLILVMLKCHTQQQIGPPSVSCTSPLELHKGLQKDVVVLFLLLHDSMKNAFKKFPFIADTKKSEGRTGEAAETEPMNGKKQDKTSKARTTNTEKQKETVAWTMSTTYFTLTEEREPTYYLGDSKLI